MDFKIKDFVLILFLLFGIFLVYIISRPLFTAIIGSVIITYIFYPLYRKILRVVKNEGVSAMMTLTIALVAFVLPLIIIIYLLIGEVQQTIAYVQQNYSNLLTCTEGYICQAIQYVQSLMNNPNFDSEQKSLYANVTKFIFGALLSIPAMIINLFIMLFISYYLLKEKDKAIDLFKSMIPLKEKDTLIKNMKHSMRAVIFSHIIISAMQASFMGIVFLFFGIPSVLLLTTLMFLAGLFPGVGIFIIWAPIVAIAFMLKNYTMATGVLIGGIIASTADNVLRPKLVGKDVIHPVNVIIGTIGGIAVFGLMGVILGPVVLNISLDIIKIIIRTKD